MMTREEIYQLTPGPATDRAVAFALKISLGSKSKRILAPAYSTEIAAAWQLVEKFRADGWLVTVKHMPPGHPFIVEGSRSEYDAPCPDKPLAQSAGKAVCELHCMKQTGFLRSDHFAIADTVPLAICRAALLAPE